MVETLRTLDWSRIQAFVAVADTGSLSAAARQLNMSQPTLGRQIKAMEAEMNITLFNRHPRGLELSDVGESLIGPARAMAEAANQMTLLAAGQVDSMGGTVRLTASMTMSMHTLPRVIASIREQEPTIQIEMVPTDTADNLLFREADIAIRMYRPEQLDLVTRQLGCVKLGLYCRRSYLGNRKVPGSLDEVLELDLVGYDREERIIRGFRQLGYDVDRTTFATRCDDHNAIWALVNAGCGIGFIPCWMGEANDDLVQCAPDLPIPPLNVWLTAHEAMRRTPRIRRVWDILVSEITPRLDPANP